MDLLNEVIRAYATLKNPKAAELVLHYISLLIQSLLNSNGMAM